MMVAAVSGAASATNSQNPKINPSRDKHAARPPLLPSEKDNSNGISNNQKKPKARIVSSRYLSPSTSTSTSNSSSVSSSSSSSRRYPSPLISSNSTSLSNAPSFVPKRSVSVDRRRPVSARALTPDLDPKNGNAADVSAAAKLLVTSSRRLSVSFQGEAFSLPISKTKVAPPSPNWSSVRKGTPERRRSNTPLRGKAEVVGVQIENSKPSDQHRWPARNRLVNPLSRSLDCSDIVKDRSKLTDECRPSVDGRLGLDSGCFELRKEAQHAPDGSVNNEASMPSDVTTSDSDSVSSGSTSGVQDCTQTSHRINGPCGLVSSAKFWQETNSRLRRLQEPGSPWSTSPCRKLIGPPKSKQYTSNVSLASPRTISSPIRGGIRSASPSKLLTPVGSSPSRGHSPSRIRNAVSTINNNFTETPSVLSFAVDVRRGKVEENKILDAHLLRLLYNQHLQWRFVNARSEAVLRVQKSSAEKNLWNAWIKISDLRDIVAKRRHRLQLLKQKLKLASVLKGQMSFLEDWASVDEDKSISLVGAVEALTASTLRLPLFGGATVNVQSLQDAIGSAVDIMQAMASSTRPLLPMVEEMNSLVSELAKVTAKEQALLEQCTEFVSLLAAMQVNDSSLRTHILQHYRVRPA